MLYAQGLLFCFYAPGIAAWMIKPSFGVKPAACIASMVVLNIRN